jgi:glycosyltransferase involved in cell wall biosynthesis
VRRPLHIIPTGVDHASLPAGDGARFRAKYGIDIDRPTLVHVGRIAHEKNIDFLLHALVEVRRRLADVLLIIAGEGPARSHLQTLATRLGLTHNVLFVGYLSRDQRLSDCYCAGDAFVFASRTETQGLVLLEAMALGVPVVSTAVLGTRDILDAGKGALVAREDPADFARQVLSLLESTKLQAELAAEGRRYVREWSPQAMTLRLCECYDSLLHAQPQLCAAQAD